MNHPAQFPRCFHKQNQKSLWTYFTTIMNKKNSELDEYTVIGDQAISWSATECFVYFLAHIMQIINESLTCRLI